MFCETRHPTPDDGPQPEETKPVSKKHHHLRPIPPGNSSPNGPSRSLRDIGKKVPPQIKPAAAPAPAPTPELASPLSAAARPL